jgi:WD40 repeat protein
MAIQGPTWLEHVSQSWRILVFLVATLSLWGCTRWRDAALPATELPLPSELSRHSQIAWFPDGQIVLHGLHPATDKYATWYRTGESETWHPLPLDAYPPCPAASYMGPSVLPDGRLGMLCAGGLKASRPLWTNVAYDWASSAITPLVPGFLPDSGAFSWRPDMRKGIFATVGAYSTLYWLTPNGTTPVTITLTDAGKSWFLPDSLRVIEAYDRDPAGVGFAPDPVGMAGSVTWSPDGKQIAFWATLETIGHPWNFPIVPWDVYLMDPASLQVERVLSDVYDPAGLAWSPDSQWLAYTSGRGNGQPQGLWIFSVQARKKVLIRKGNYSDFVWAPDGRALLALQCLDDVCQTTNAWIYDVSSLVSDNPDRR